jgi:hypothetical protein
MKWISPVLGFGTWITRFSFEETGRTVGAGFEARGFTAAPAVASRAVGAAATIPAAAIPLRATLRKPLREMSCIATPPCRPTFVGPVGGFVSVLESNDSLGACGTEVYSSPVQNPDVTFEEFLRNLHEGDDASFRER